MRHGLHPLRRAGAALALVAATAAIWLPDALAGTDPSAGRTAAALVIAALFLGLAANGTSLCWLARGYPPDDLPPADRTGIRAANRRLTLALSIPAALFVLVLQGSRMSRPDPS